MAENNNLIPTEPDWDGTPMSRSEEILYSIIHTEEWDGTPMSRGEYFLVQLKDAVESMSMMDIKGTVPTVADLPATGNKKGDVYAVGPEEQLNKPEYYWDGTSWQYLGQIVDLSGYLPLTGGTMSGDLNFNIGGTTVRVGANGSYPVVVGGGSNSAPFEIVGLNGLNLIPNSGSVTIGQSANPALTSNGNVTSVWGGNSMEVKSPISTTVKGHETNGTATNTITLDSNGITETTLAKKVVTTATGIELGTTSVDNTVSVSTPLKKLSVSSPVQMDINSGGNVSVTGYGNVSVTATAGSMTEFANGDFSTRADSGSNSIYGRQGVNLTAGISQSTIGYVTATHGLSVPASDSTNKVATTAIAHSIADANIGKVPFGTCSSAADAVAKTVTVTNFPGLVDGATINVLFENANSATNPTLNVNESGAQPIMRTTTTAVGTNQASSWTSGGALVSLMYVQNTGWMLTDYTTYGWVSQNNNTSNTDYRVLLSSSSTDGPTSAGVNKSGNLIFNPSTKTLTLSGGSNLIKSTNLDLSNNPSTATDGNAQLKFVDVNGTRHARIYTRLTPNGQSSMFISTYGRNTSGDEISNYIALRTSSDGTRSYTVSNPSAFCDAIGLGSVLSDISSIQATIGDINTVLEEVL